MKIFLPLVSEAAKIAQSVTHLIDPRLIPLCQRSFKDISFLPLGTKDMQHDEYKNKLDRQYHRLTDPDEMGKLFKVLYFSNNNSTVPEKMK